MTTTVFDAFGRLVADNQGGTVQNYTYDGLDRLATRNSAPFTYAGLEKEPATDYSSSFSRDPDGDLVAVGTSAGNWATVTDTHGDLVAAFTTAGALTDSRSYDPFGDPVVGGNPAVHVGFQGSWTDPDTDRVSAQARWYTPGTGTFASRDTASLPISGTAAANRYTYAAANPLTYNDPTGFFAFSNMAKAAAAAVRRVVAPAPPVFRPPMVLKPAAQRQWVQSAEDKFWAGVNAALAFRRAGIKPVPAQPAPLSAEAQRQIASMGADKFWAGVRASLAGVKPPAPAPPRPPALSPEAQRQIASMGADKFWAGVRAYQAGVRPPAPAKPKATPKPAPAPAPAKKDCPWYGCTISSAVNKANKVVGGAVKSTISYAKAHPVETVLTIGSVFVPEVAVVRGAVVAVRAVRAGSIAAKAGRAAEVTGGVARASRAAEATSSAAAKAGRSVNEVERIASKPVKPGQAVDRWEDFLGPGPHTNAHPRTGLPDANRIVSADGARSIRFGAHEMGSSPTKFHYHEETWSFDPTAQIWNIDNVVVRVPFPKGSW
ncbi:RHS repeat domain-containing protein [Parafrankia sp. EUN1f]|uniref:RHS repeat domain-containing protein n=1 Tax=Parafrankia sp. EUN1f TaxID=102897 RepID=UPI0001C443A8|nr:RHS repeat-associated core domain-containing protein [Parafrankia sp. EUN1f]EFC82513.1 YD repeat protein [Parafrankia sp. EUN1f]